MAAVTAKLVKELRERTSAGMMDCKKALDATDGDLDKASEWLRTKGLAQAGKKASRVAAEGSVLSYIHMGGKIGVLLEVNCETDFVSRGDDFQGFCRDIGMHIAAANPSYVSRDEVPEDAIAKERTLFEAEIREQGKPENIIQKIVDGKIDKWMKEICLLDQEFVKPAEDGGKQTVEQVRINIVQKTGENVQIRRFIRYVLGEGIEKKKENLAEEVAKMQDAARAAAAPAS